MNKNTLASAIAAIALIALVLLLAGNVGFWLYNPSYFTPALASCTLDILQGSAEVQTPVTIAWEEAQNGMTLEPGSRVRTGEDGQVLLTFAEGSTTKLGPGSDLVVAKLEGNQDNYPDVIMLRQLLGSTWNQVAKIPGNQHRYEVQTPATNVMARGTLFLVNVDASGRTVTQTTEGQVDVSAQSRLVHVFAGQQTEAALGAAPSAPVPMLPASNELILTVSTPAVGLVIDPHGASTGYLPDGSVINQIAGSSLSVREASSHSTVIPKLSSGEYTVVLHGVAQGKAAYRIEALSNGQSTYQYGGSYDAATGSEWQLRLKVDVTGGLARVSIIDPNVIGNSAEARAPAPEMRPPGPVTDYPDGNSAWPLAPVTHSPVGNWAASAVLVILLGAIYLRLCQSR